VGAAGEELVDGLAGAGGQGDAGGAAAFAGDGQDAVAAFGREAFGDGGGDLGGP
jgi:hypothetical protein